MICAANRKRRRPTMLMLELLRDKGILIVKPQGAIDVGDFDRLAQTADPYIGDHGALCGLLIEHWLIEHRGLAHDHHRKIRRVTAGTNSSFLKVVPMIDRSSSRPVGNHDIWRRGESSRPGVARER